MTEMRKAKIAIFASGRGTNAQKIVEKSADMHYNTALIVSNKQDAQVLDFAAQKGIKTLVLERNSFYNTTDLLEALKAENIDLIVLAGFLWLVPEYLIEAYNDRIVNIHPALLPKYGGKGMYGMKVHEAVKRNGEKESGITIHLVNKEYDKGEIVFQATVALSEEDTAEEIAKKVLELEHEYFAQVVDKVICEKLGFS
jgi:phosphoribosylglycinamide formyltransferase 1